MKKLKSVFLAAACLSVLALTVSLVTSTPTASAPPPPPPPVDRVEVVNTPLPVQGTVNANITNSVVLPVTGAVSVTSLPAVTLNGTSPVSLSNTSATPVFADTDGPARSAVGASCEVQFPIPTPPYTGTQVQCLLTTVPSGQILVIETVSCGALATPGGGVMQQILLNVGSPAVGGGGPINLYHTLALQRVGNASFADIYGITTPVRIYAAGGTGVYAIGTGASGPNLTADMNCSISGHLVNP